MLRRSLVFCLVIAVFQGLVLVKGEQYSTSNRFVFIQWAPVFQKVGSAIHRINFFLADNAIVSRNTYPLDSDLSGG